MFNLYHVLYNEANTGFMKVMEVFSMSYEDAMDIVDRKGHYVLQACLANGDGTDVVEKKEEE